MGLRARWHRVVGHRFISPITGAPVHILIPSVEAHPPRLVGRCKCGKEWWSNGA